MVELECTLYDVGDVIVREGDRVTDLIFVVSGSCVLNGIHETKKFDYQKYERLKNQHIYPRSQPTQLEQNDEDFSNDTEEFRIKVVTLREGSWFGDY